MLNEVVIPLNEKNKLTMCGYKNHESKIEDYCGHFFLNDKINRDDFFGFNNFYTFSKTKYEFENGLMINKGKVEGITAYYGYFSNFKIKNKESAATLLGIGFLDKSKGCGTAALKYLSNYAKNKNMKKFVIESILDSPDIFTDEENENLIKDYKSENCIRNLAFNRRVEIFNKIANKLGYNQELSINKKDICWHLD